MDFKKLADKAKDTIDKRGGMDSLKADAEELPATPPQGRPAAQRLGHAKIRRCADRSAAAELQQV
jgi:hypothetical protein